MKLIKIHITLLSLLLQFLCQGSAFSQGVTPRDPLDSDQSMELYYQASRFYAAGSYMEALNFAEQGLQESMISENKKSEQLILELMGDLFVAMDESADGISYYLKAAGEYIAAEDTAKQITLFRKLATAYGKEQVHSKEQEYLQRALDILPPEQQDERLDLLARIGNAAFHGENYERALLSYREILPEFDQGTAPWINLKRDLASTYIAMGNYDSALVIGDELYQIYLEQGKHLESVKILNNMANYHTLKGEYEKASKIYLEAFDLANIHGLSETDFAALKSNAGVCFTNMGKSARAIKQFNRAIELLKEKENLGELARNENMLAYLYFETKDLYNAGNLCRDAISSAKAAPDPWQEAQAYRLYSGVLREGNDPVNALVYYEKYLAIRDSIEFARRIELQQLETQRNQLEQQERELQLRLKEEEVSDLVIRQLRLQNERIQQEREIILQEKNLEMLQQDSLRQSLIIKDQLFLVQQQEREKQILENEKRLADLEAEQERSARESAERETAFADNKARLAELEAQKQKDDKQALVWSIAIVGLLTIVVLVSLISSRRKNYLLAKQKREIEDKNLDLEQKNEEISTQRDEIEAQRNLVFDQKQAIEAFNDEILKSIEYAKRLQTASLPPIPILEDNVNEQFVFFRPRDVVSGDFYWFAEVEGRLVATVADSTGHGVPGAFMSIMGMSILRDLVQKEYITHPGVILRRMRKEIIGTMGQKGMSGEQRDGMDMALISYDPAEQKLDFAGAFNALYLVRSIKHPAPVIEEAPLPPKMEHNGHSLYEIPADKMPVAHYDKMDKFKNHEISIHPGDIVYMSSDGFPDQFGGPKGKKYMYKPFKKLLLENSGESMSEQHRILGETLDQWMGNIEQVDDICVMGIRF